MATFVAIINNCFDIIVNYTCLVYTFEDNI